MKTLLSFFFAPAPDPAGRNSLWLMVAVMALSVLAGIVQFVEMQRSDSALMQAQLPLAETALPALVPASAQDQPAPASMVRGKRIAT